ncbi:MAG TPA: hypothetical protein VJ725_27140 [Thermoanaerobaculia bacterium]|nr:hypothetical protein [Thermoanaerobaculia bacterium]
MRDTFHAEVARHVLAGLEPGEEERLLHLLTCDSCRSWAVDALAKEPAAEPRDPYGEILDRVAGRLPETIAGVLVDQEESARLLGELLSLPRDARLRGITEPPYRAAGLLDLLLAESHAAQPTDPARADELASLAVALAQGLETAEPGSPALRLESLARALGLAGNARRLRGDLPGAAAALSEAAGLAVHTAGRAWSARLLGLLRWEQGRLDEAAALFERAARIYAGDGLPRDEAACFALLGLLWTEEREPFEPLHPLEQAWKGLGPEERPWLWVRTGLSLALALAGHGLAGRARAVRHEAWALYPLLDREEEAMAAWLEGRVAVLLEEEEAGSLLDAARRRLTELGHLPEAALATLDLALHLGESGREQEIAELLRELAEAFSGKPGAHLAAAGLQSLAHDFEEGDEEGYSAEERRELAACLAAGLRQALRLSGSRPRPVPFA